MPIPQNGQTHSHNLPTNCFSVFDHFVKLALKGLKCVKNDIKNVYDSFNWISNEHCMDCLIVTLNVSILNCLYTKNKLAFIMGIVFSRNLDLPKMVGATYHALLSKKASQIWLFHGFLYELWLRSSHRVCSIKIVLKNFAKFTWKDLCWILVFHKLVFIMGIVFSSNLDLPKIVGGSSGATRLIHTKMICPKNLWIRYYFPKFIIFKYTKIFPTFSKKVFMITGKIQRANRGVPRDFKISTNYKTQQILQKYAMHKIFYKTAFAGAENLA